MQAAYELGVALWENNRLLEFRYGGNSLHGIAAAALLGGGKFDDQGLKHSGSLKRLYLQVCRCAVYIDFTYSVITTSLYFCWMAASTKVALICSLY